ncbi:MAG: Gfo/Idh/MocA family oxidoreductase [Anaerohalosphaeraceae bacterium]|nr:Gfo/Idh/MocA family oxidoreductase [Anaerohalosphaeraceae bacterium]
MEKYKAAVIGLGNVAWKYDLNRSGGKGTLQTHTGVYQAHNEVILVGGCSNEQKDCQDFSQHYKVPAFESVDELLKQTSPEIVSICSSTKMHFEHTCRCIEAGVPMIWLEKPPAEDLADLEKLIEMQKGSRSTVLVNYQRRYCDCYNRLKGAYAEQVFGKTVSIHLTYSRGLQSNGAHIIDILSLILGDKASLSLENISIADSSNPSFCLKTSDGVSVFVTGMKLPYHCIDIELTCEQGRLAILYGGMETRVETKVEHKLFHGFYRLEETESDILGPGGIEGAMLMALNDLVTSHQQNREPVSNLTTAGETLAIVNNVERAVGIDR